jgi:prevent-host-death family protein
MVVVTSKEAKEKFGVLVDTARREPVTITKHNRPSVVVMSKERYDELEAAEDRIWIERAIEAEKGGFLGPEESEAFLKGIPYAEG